MPWGSSMSWEDFPQDVISAEYTFADCLGKKQRMLPFWLIAWPAWIAYRMDEDKRMKNWNLLFPSGIEKLYNIKERTLTTRQGSNLSLTHAIHLFPVLLICVSDIFLRKALFSLCVCVLVIINIISHDINLWEANRLYYRLF